MGQDTAPLNKSFDTATTSDMFSEDRCSRSFLSVWNEKEERFPFDEESLLCEGGVSVLADLELMETVTMDYSEGPTSSADNAPNVVKARGISLFEAHQAVEAQIGHHEVQKLSAKVDSQASIKSKGDLPMNRSLDNTEETSTVYSEDLFPHLVLMVPREEDAENPFDKEPILFEEAAPPVMTTLAAAKNSTASIKLDGSALDSDGIVFVKGRGVFLHETCDAIEAHTGHDGLSKVVNVPKGANRPRRKRKAACAMIVCVLIIAAIALVSFGVAKSDDGKSRGADSVAAANTSPGTQSDNVFSDGVSPNDEASIPEMTNMPTLTLHLTQAREVSSEPTTQAREVSSEPTSSATPQEPSSNPSSAPTSCRNLISTDKSCYVRQIENILVDMKQCEPQTDDWIGIYLDGNDPQNLGSDCVSIERGLFQSVAS
jgi:hypothetical protein